MALYYFDTSALAKRYMDETGSHWVDDVCLHEEVATSSLVRVEIASALARRVREGIIAADQADALYRQFRTDELGYVVVELSATVLTAAAEILLLGQADSRLRALDALHLASARVSFGLLGRGEPGKGWFATSDRRLAREATALGLTVVNPEEM